MSTMGSRMPALPSRRSRSLETVIVQEAKIFKIVQNIADFLHPSGRRCYNEYGIPYLRGHLYYGSPGTGKTSLGFALAEKFGLTIHSMSLSDQSLTDFELGMLFLGLPDLCVVLLEDIDATELVQRRAHKTSGRQHKPTAAESTIEDKEGQGISLSGLLNAIDGVASVEGIILIMTTNHSENIDEAILRPGRIDLKIESTLLKKEDLRDLFIRMYTFDAEPVRAQKTSPVAFIDVKADKTSSFEPTDLRAMAVQFAAQLPEIIFSGAQNQGYLIFWKRDPHGALAAMGEWVKDQMSAEAMQGPKSTRETYGKGFDLPKERTILS